MYPVTMLAAVILGLWLIILSIRVIDVRRTTGIDAHEAPSRELARRIRAQANLVEYAPIALILLFLAEASAASIWVTGFCATLLIVGRLVHGIAFSFKDSWVFGRVGGMGMTFGSIALLALTNVWLLFF